MAIIEREREREREQTSHNIPSNSNLPSVAFELEDNREKLIKNLISHKASVVGKQISRCCMAFTHDYTCQTFD